MRNKIAVITYMLRLCEHRWLCSCTCTNIYRPYVHVLNKFSLGLTFAQSVLYTCLKDVSNIYVVLVLFLLTEELKNTLDVGFEFNNLVYEPEYENLENPTTETLVKRIEDAVSAIFMIWRQHIVFVIGII